MIVLKRTQFPIYKPFPQTIYFLCSEIRPFYRAQLLLFTEGLTFRFSRTPRGEAPFLPPSLDGTSVGMFSQ